MDNANNPEVLAVVPLPSVAGAQAQGNFASEADAPSNRHVLAGEPLGLNAARDLGRELRHTYPELVDELQPSEE